jgi:hypothetical protein
MIELKENMALLGRIGREKIAPMTPLRRAPTLEKTDKIVDTSAQAKEGVYESRFASALDLIRERWKAEGEYVKRSLAEHDNPTAVTKKAEKKVKLIILKKKKKNLTNLKQLFRCLRWAMAGCGM